MVIVPDRPQIRAFDNPAYIDLCAPGGLRELRYEAVLFDQSGAVRRRSEIRLQSAADGCAGWEKKDFFGAGISLGSPQQPQIVIISPAL